MVLLAVYAISARAQAATTSTPILLLTRLTVIEQAAQVTVAEKTGSDHFRVKLSASNAEDAWQDTGNHHPAFANEHRVAIEEATAESERGRRPHPKPFGQLEAKGLDYARISPLKQKISQR
jgi:hypothetical protein